MRKDQIIKVRADAELIRLVDKLKKTLDRSSRSEVMRFAVRELARRMEDERRKKQDGV